jgi:hypothetical protein
MITHLEQNFITPRLQGRTGNIMFQVAHSYVKSLEYNRQLVVPSAESSTKHLENTLFRKVNFYIKVSDEIENTKFIWSQFTYEDLKPEDNTPTAFAGWYQSEKFFKGYNEAVKDLFSPPISFKEKVHNIYPFFNNQIIAAISVRRGDYLTQPTRHPVISKEFIFEAFKRLPEHDKLLIVTDDMEWCKNNIDLPNMVINDNNIFWDAEALWLLSMCDHYIISNSSFSWWGAWLSRSPKKIVVSPSIWFGPDVEYDPKDIWCEDWIKVPCAYNSGSILPN